MAALPQQRFDALTAPTTVAFESFHGYPAGLRIQVIDTARLSSLGQEMLKRQGGDILDIDALPVFAAEAPNDAS